MKWFLILLAAAAVVVGGALYWRHSLDGRDGASSAAGGKEGGPPGGRVVPVVAVPATVKDVPIYLDGLGNVAGYRTVTVRTQVDGRLDRVDFKEGQAVKRGDVLAEIDPRPFQIQLHQAEGALARDQSALRDDKRNLERYATLRDKKLVAEQQVDDQHALVGQLEGAVRVDEAQIEAAKLNLTYAKIVSPIDGVVGLRIVDPGNIVHAADPNGIVVVAQLDPIAVLFTLPEDELPRVMLQQQKAPLLVEAWSRDGTIKLGTGSLLTVDNQINAATATMRLKASFDNKQRLLWPNQFVKARLLLDVRRGALTIPATAIQRGPQGTYVYVVTAAAPPQADRTAEVRTVEIAEMAGDLAIVGKGLAAGELVVSDGQNQLKPGARVNPRPPAGQGKPPAGAAPTDGQGPDRQRPPSLGGPQPTPSPGRGQNPTPR